MRDMPTSISADAWLAAIQDWRTELSCVDVTLDEALDAVDEIRTAIRHGDIVSHRTNQIADVILETSTKAFNKAKQYEFKWMQNWMREVRAKQMASQYN